MAAAAALIVSKRLQSVTAALLCIAAMQMVLALSSCHPEPLPMGATRVVIQR
jgi:hypothetical protein